MSRKYSITQEVYKYPYSGVPDDNGDYLFDKIYQYTVRVWKKIVKKTRWLIAYGERLLRLGTNNFLPQIPPFPFTIKNDSIMRLDSNNLFSKEKIITQVKRKVLIHIKEFSETEIDKLYYISIKYKNKELTKQQLINQLNEFQGGGFKEKTVRRIIIASTIISCIIIVILQHETSAFQKMVPQHLRWLCSNNNPDDVFGYQKAYRGPKTIQVSDLTRNAGIGKNESSFGFYEEIMKELQKQSTKREISIQVYDQIYCFKNLDSENAEQLKYRLAEKLNI